MTLDPHTLTHVLALAAILEGEGQINNAKLLRAAVDSLLTRSARHMNLSKDRAALVTETTRAIAALAEAGVDPLLLQAVERSRSALAEGRLSLYEETPDPYVCRTCGHVLMETAVCPNCGAHPDSFKRFRPIYWLEAMDPFVALASLREIPKRVGALLERANGGQGSKSLDGEWSLEQAVTHLSDAQGVLEYRVNLILDHDNPVLESQAVFEWADEAKSRPQTAREIYEGYCASRERTLARLENIALKDWWRRGRHEEFGELKLSQQVSYFATHEIDHLPQIERLVS